MAGDPAFQRSIQAEGLVFNVYLEIPAAGSGIKIIYSHYTYLFRNHYFALYFLMTGLLLGHGTLQLAGRLTPLF